MSKESFVALILAEEETELTLEALAAQARVHPDWIRTLMDYGILEPRATGPSGPRFEASAVLTLRRVVRLRRELGINLPGAAVILELCERLEELQREVEELRLRLG